MHQKKELLARISKIIIGASISQYASYTTMFCLLHSNINKEQHESISAIYPAITENMENSLVKHAPQWAYSYLDGSALFHRTAQNGMAYSVALFSKTEQVRVRVRISYIILYAIY